MMPVKFESSCGEMIVGEGFPFDGFGFRRMAVWREAQALADSVGELVVETSKRVDADVIGRQLMRAAGSVPANIAEGYGRYSRRAYRNYLGIARASLFEVVSWMDLHLRRKLVSKDKHDVLLARADKVGRMLTVRMKSLDDSGPSVRDDSLDYEV